MESWDTGNTVVNGVRLQFTRTGGNKPPVVLAHGFSDSGLCWTPVAQALEADYDLVMVDARGHGFSDAPEKGYTLREMASDLQGVITSLGLVRPAIIGHSMGGGTTLALAGLYPDVPGAIILEDAGGTALSGLALPSYNLTNADFHGGAFIELQSASSAFPYSTVHTRGYLTSLTGGTVPGQAPVPEPTSVCLMLLGLGVLASSKFSTKRQGRK